LLSAPLRDRFHIVEGLEFYGDDELARIVTRTAKLLALPASPEGALEIGRRSRGTPRIANRLTRRVRDFVQVSGDGSMERDAVSSHLDRLQVDSCGLNRHDRRILEMILDTFDGGPVGVEALAASLGTPRDTLEGVHEPFLLQRGFLIRSPRGRMTTVKAVEHLGREAKLEAKRRERAANKGPGKQTSLLD
jgi:Holliday junction DNA helicase RuvB